jgi:hypothetical protein
MAWSDATAKGQKEVADRSGIILQISTAGGQFFLANISTSMSKQELFRQHVVPLVQGM